MTPTERAIELALVQGCTTAFLDAQLRHDTQAQDWLQHGAWSGLRARGSGRSNSAMANDSAHARLSTPLFDFGQTRRLSTDFRARLAALREREPRLAVVADWLLDEYLRFFAQSQHLPWRALAVFEGANIVRRWRSANSG